MPRPLQVITLRSLFVDYFWCYCVYIRQFFNNLNTIRAFTCSLNRFLVWSSYTFLGVAFTPTFSEGLETVIWFVIENFEVYKRISIVYFHVHISTIRFSNSQTFSLWLLSTRILQEWDVIICCLNKLEQFTSKIIKIEFAHKYSLEIDSHSSLKCNASDYVESILFHMCVYLPCVSTCTCAFFSKNTFLLFKTAIF